MTAAALAEIEIAAAIRAIPGVSVPIIAGRRIADLPPSCVMVAALSTERLAPDSTVDTVELTIQVDTHRDAITAAAHSTLAREIELLLSDPLILSEALADLPPNAGGEVLEYYGSDFASESYSVAENRMTTTFRLNLWCAASEEEVSSGYS
jgi:hypothetical protein